MGLRTGLKAEYRRQILSRRPVSSHDIKPNFPSLYG